MVQDVETVLRNSVVQDVETVLRNSEPGKLDPARQEGCRCGPWRPKGIEYPSPFPPLRSPTQQRGVLAILNKYFHTFATLDKESSISTPFRKRNLSLKSTHT